MKIHQGEHFKTIPDCILFDLDNTFYSYDFPHETALKAVAEKVSLNFSISDQDFQNAFKEGRDQIKETLNNTASSHSRLLYFQRMFEVLGLGSQPLSALDLEQTYWRTFLTNIKLFPNAKELLEDIRLLGIPSAVITDLTAQIQFRKLIYLELDHYFDYVVSSEEAGFDKPDSKIFELAITKINPKGKNIWMIGDDAKKDISGAKNTLNAVTMQKIHPSASLGSSENTPDASFKDFAELRNLLKKLTNP